MLLDVNNSDLPTYPTCNSEGESDETVLITYVRPDKRGGGVCLYIHTVLQ